MTKKYWNYWVNDETTQFIKFAVNHFYIVYKVKKEKPNIDYPHVKSWR